MIMATAELRLLTVRDYHKMVDSGILAADEPVELIEGQLYRMVAKGTAHSAAMTRLDRASAQRLSGRALLRWQDPVQLGDLSEPEPDLAVVQIHPLDYEDHHPQPAEIFLLVEVADTTLQRDLELKASVYSRAGIADYWVLDVQNRCLHVLREPEPVGYANVQILDITDTCAPLAFADCQICVGDFFRSV
jgi:Uma2 family endonuclease